jgi:DNA topoisomerase IA
MKTALSAFLKSLSALFSTPGVQSATAMESISRGQHAISPVQPVKSDVQGDILVFKSRAPVLSPEDVAAYWKGGLDYVDFSSFGDKSEDAVAHKMILALDEVPQVATQIEEGLVGEDVSVVLLLCQRDRRDQRLKKRHPLLAVPALLVEEKFLAPRTTAAPILNPAYLSPDQKGNTFAISDGQKANQKMFEALAALSGDDSLQVDWATWWSTALNVVQEMLRVEQKEALLWELATRANEVASSSTRQGKPSANGLKKSSSDWSLVAAVFPAQGAAAKSILDVYTSFLDAGELPQIPLFERFCGGEDALQAASMPSRIADLITGHIDEYDDSKGNRPLFPLDESQRRAACAVASLQEGEIQAINGPPGSGKTSMLRAVVASRWVSAALDQGACPIIVACGATNQSVTNVIGAFGKAPHPDEALPHAKRWIAGIPSYGAYFASKSLLGNTDKQAELARFICVQSDQESTGMLWSYKDRPGVLTPNNALEFEETYLVQARRVFPQQSLSNVEAAIEVIHQKLIDTVRLRDTFLDHLAKGHSDWLVLLDNARPTPATLWPRDRHDQLDRLIGNLEKNRGDVEAARGAIDLTFSCDAFHWAARYWEGRFLLAQRERLFSRHPANVEESLRRLCMLTPCLVSTLHNVSTLGKMNPLVDGDSAIQYTFSLFDLLVIDEAGQASPELAGAALLMAKRAAVVGDLKQLEPIWNHKALSEIAVASAAGVFSRLNELKQSRLSIADGNVLGAARLVSKWREEQDLGITLRYHYRCKPSIIGYCNALSYNDTLVPRTSEGKPVHEPAMSWVSIESKPMRKGGSLCNPMEVEHITSWIGERWPAWQVDPATKGKPIQDIVALITAYRPQANLLQAGLEKVFDQLRGTSGIAWPSADDIKKVTVGTVHQLQGAERPIVCFSLVEGPDEAAGSFMDRDASLLNVAVSRAKSSFIVFGDPKRLFPAAEANEAGLAPIHFLGAYLRRTPQARLLYPRRLVVIEAGGKQQTLSRILGKSCAVIATHGALQFLPIRGGLDVPGGLIPLPRNEAGAEAFLDEAGKIIDAVEDVVIATDDDRMGELIAWQVAQLLKERASGKSLLRVRLGAINGPAVRAAFDAPGAIDERKVVAESVREIVDLLVTQRFCHDSVRCLGVEMREFNDLVNCGACTPLRGKEARFKLVGRVQGAILRLLLEHARRAVSLQAHSRIRVKALVGSEQVVGYLFDVSEQRDLTRTSQVGQITSKLSAARLELLNPPEIIREQVHPPVAGTFSILAEAWQRFGYLPWQSMEALQALYDGSWGDVSGDEGFEPDDPIIPSFFGSGHPPVVPLDRAAPPTVLGGAFSNPVCRDIYTIIWDRFNFAESVGDAGAQVTRVRVEYLFSGQQRLGVRFEGVSADQLTAEQLRLIEQAKPTNGAATLQYHFSEISDAALELEGESAGRWVMSIDQLLLEMEEMNIGRPSTCASALEKLVSKGLLEPPVHKGQLRLSPAGLKTALTLEGAVPELSSPGFCARLAGLLEDVEHNQVSSSNALAQLLPLLITEEKDCSEIEKKIWTSLETVQKAQDLRRAGKRGGGLVSSVSRAAST